MEKSPAYKMISDQILTTSFGEKGDVWEGDWVDGFTNTRTGRHEKLSFILCNPLCFQFRQDPKSLRNGPSAFSRKRDIIYERDGWKCKCCGTEKDLTLDHIIPKFRGGHNGESNLQTLCKRCNNIKGHKVLSIKKLRILVNQGKSNT